MADELNRLLRSLNAQRNAGVYVYVLAAPGLDVAALQPVASFREAEGLTLIVEESRALKAELGVRYRAAWLTLNLQSQLSDVGLTAAVATALAAAHISCNVVAALHHDHLFVPVEAADSALAALRALQAQASAAG